MTSSNRCLVCQKQFTSQKQLQKHLEKYGLVGYLKHLNRLVPISHEQWHSNGIN